MFKLFWQTHKDRSATFAVQPSSSMPQRHYVRRVSSGAGRLGIRGHSPMGHEETTCSDERQQHHPGDPRPQSDHPKECSASVENQTLSLRRRDYEKQSGRKGRSPLGYRLSGVFCLPPRRVSPTASNILQHLDEDPIAALLALPLREPDIETYGKAIEAAFTRLIHYAETAETYDDYVDLCMMCDKFLNRQPLRVAFGLAYWSDDRLRRHVEALFSRAGQEFSEACSASTSTFRVVMLAFLRLLCSMLAEASFELTEALSLHRFFSDALARMIVEGMAFYAATYFQQTTVELSLDTRTNDLSGTTLRTPAPSDEVLEESESGAAVSNSVASSSADHHLVTRLRETASQMQTVTGERLPHSQSLECPTQPPSSPRRTGTLSVLGSLRSGRLSPRHWSTAHGDLATSVDDELASGQQSAATSSEQHQSLRRATMEQLSHSLGLFIFGTLYVNIGTVPNCQRKLFVIFRYFSEANECANFLVPAAAYWLDVMCHSRPVFEMVATLTPLCTAALRFLTRAIQLASTVFQGSLNGNGSNNQTMAYTNLSSSFMRRSVSCETMDGPVSRPSVLASLLSLVGRGGSSTARFYNHHHHHSKDDNSSAFNLLEYLRAMTRVLLLRLVTHCTAHSYHTVEGRPRPLYYGVPVEELLRKKSHGHIGVRSGNILTCEDPALVALRECSDEVAYMTSLALTETWMIYVEDEEQAAAEEEEERECAMKSRTLLLLILENHGLFETSPLTRSALVSARYKELLHCAYCGRWCTLHDGSPKTARKLKYRHPLVCPKCDMVRYCSPHCEKRFKEIHSLWCCSCSDSLA